MTERIDRGTGEVTTATVCACCYYAPSNARYQPWYSWMCQHETAKLSEWFNPVTGQTIADPPRRKCKDINNGACPNWAEGVNIMGLKVKSSEDIT